MSEHETRPECCRPGDPSEDSVRGRVRALQDRGVRVVDPCQTFVDSDVDVARIDSSAVLHPGTRLHGPSLLLGPRVEVGTEGPATLRDCAFGADTAIASGFAHGAVLLDGASLGANAHVRPGTLLEEQASTAHAVGLKHTVLLSFVTLGSLINFCDCLMAGGRSRKDHSEVGSGYIHFNFTPWGARGDKATPSLFGDVSRGVLLREDRIFLGGSGGCVGPRAVGFGAVTGAGQVTRRDVPAHTMSVQAAPEVSRDFQPGTLDRLEPRAAANARYLGQLAALRAWYTQVRAPRAAATGDHHPMLIEAALGVLDLALAERLKRLQAFASERGGTVGTGDQDLTVEDLHLAAQAAGPCPEALAAAVQETGGDTMADHVTWVQALGDDVVAAGSGWLEAVADAVGAVAAVAGPGSR
ncbi:MAG: UDP-N-acetylglucosamine pyrophosphorylase [Nannocystaceae bacterium]